MAKGKIRTYDSNIDRKANKQFHQFEKNIFEKNHFANIAIITEILDTNWCKAKIIPTYTRYLLFNSVLL